MELHRCHSQQGYPQVGDNSGVSSLKNRGDEVHLFKAVLGRWRVFVGGHHHAQFHTAHATAIAHIDAAHFARWRRGRHRGGHAFQHAEADFPNKDKQKPSYGVPNEVAEGGHFVTFSCVFRLAQALDDGGVGHAAALTHRLQAVAAAGALKFIQERGHEACA